MISRAKIKTILAKQFFFAIGTLLKGHCFDYLESVGSLLVFFCLIDFLLSNVESETLNVIITLLSFILCVMQLTFAFTKWKSKGTCHNRRRCGPYTFDAIERKGKSHFGIASCRRQGERWTLLWLFSKKLGLYCNTRVSAEAVKLSFFQNQSLSEYY